MMKTAKLVGGPWDGATIVIRESANNLMAIERPPASVDADHVIAPAYLDAGDGERFTFVGWKSRHEMLCDREGHRIDLENYDDSEWWKR